VPNPPPPGADSSGSATRFGISRPTTSIASATIAEATKTAWMAGSSTLGVRCSRSGTPRPRCEATTAFAIAPNTATPTALPTERANIAVPVATPRCCHVTADWRATIDGLATRPKPKPITKQGAARCQIELPESTVSSSAVPAHEIAPPISIVVRNPTVR